jgi:hypothetical protein
VSLASERKRERNYERKRKKKKKRERGSDFDKTGRKDAVSAVGA